MTSPEQAFAAFRHGGDPAALAAVFDALAPELLLVACHVGRGGEPEDLVQATFLDAIEKRDRWDDRRPLRPWLVGILVNHARLERRRRSRRIDAERLPAPEPTNALDELGDEEIVARITATVAALPAHLRPTLTLRLLHGLSPTQIAHALGCPIATVKTRLQRGLAALRRALPAGIVGSLAGLLLADRSLAAARATVLGAAGRTATAVGAFGAVSAIAMKKIAAGVAFVCLGLLALFATGVLTPDAGPEPAASPSAGVAHGGIDVAAEAGTAAHTPERAAVRPSDATTVESTGSVELTFVWSGTELPAGHLQFWWCTAGDGPRPLQRRQADARGNASLTALAPGDYEVRSLGPILGRIAIRGGEHGTQRIEVRPTLARTGKVVDQDGRGVPDAEIFVQNFSMSEDAVPRLAGTSAADGTFRLRADRVGSCWARAAGFAPSALRDLQPESGGPLEFVLPRGSARVRGTVVATNGVYIAECEVLLIRTRPVDEVAAPILVSADAAGRFDSGAILAGDYLLVADSADAGATTMALSVAPRDCLELAVPLGQGATVTGTVRFADGTPARALITADLTLIGAPSTGAARALDPIRQRIRSREWSDQHGRFRLAGLPVGEAWLSFRTNRTADLNRIVTLREGEVREFDLTLEPGHSVTGRIVDIDGAPVPNWNVEAWTIDGDGQAWAQTDSSGHFELAGLGAGRCRLRARTSGDDTGLLPLFVDAVETDGKPLGFVALPVVHGGRLRGTLAAHPPNSPGRRQIAATRTGFPRECTTTFRLRDPTSYDIGPLPPGEYDLEIRQADQRPIPLGRHRVGR
ncbi:MAG: sigma-70 family RNA polymerase sigma factor [Planctomycetes bacterium]|nr:sigma-70 family RNA polymerase sigma factor [Planctomycetota bacterium]